MSGSSVDKGHGQRGLQESLSVDASASPAALALHNNFRTSVVSLKRDLIRTIHYLSAIKAQKVYRALGFSSIYDYAQTAAGFTQFQTRSFLEIGRRLTALPRLKRALGNGEISWTKATHIARKADPGTEQEWIDLAQTMTTQQLAKYGPGIEPKAEKKPASPKRGARPPKKRHETTISRPLARQPGPKPADATCHMTFALKPEDYSRWEKLNAALRRKYPGETKEGLMLRGLATLLEEEGDPASSPHLLVIHECPTCNTATHSNARGEFAADRALLESAQCDATIQSPDGTRRAIIPPRIRRQVLARDHHRCQAPNCRRGGFLQVHHRVPLAQGGTTALDNLVTLCAACHRRVHDTEKEMNRARKDPLD